MIKSKIRLTCLFNNNYNLLKKIKYLCLFVFFFSNPSFSDEWITEKEKNNFWEKLLESSEKIIDYSIESLGSYLEDLEIIDYLQDTYHTYEIDGKSILKRTAWFKMKAKGNMQLTPQIEEGISKAEWVNRSDIDKKTNKTFATIRDLLSMI